MNRRTLAIRSLRFFWRTNLGVLLGAAIGAAVLVGAMVVGDSVRMSLREQALLRIGTVDVALVAGDRLVRDQLADAIATSLDAPRAAPVLHLDGIVATPDGSSRANRVGVLGVDDRFFALAASPGDVATVAPATVLLNERLARQLDAEIGDEIIVRLEKPSAMPRDMVMAQNDELSLGLRVTVAGLVTDASFGRFSLEANQVPPHNAFLDLGWLQDQLELSGRANLVLVAGADTAAADAALGEAWTLADAELGTHTHSELGVVDLVSTRVFIDEPIVASAREAAPAGTGILTYFVNELRLGEHSTPYSMVTAVDPPAHDAGWTAPVPADLADDEIVLNDWLADDLGAQQGDEIQLRYFVLGETRRLVEEETTFRVRSIVELAGPAGDPTLMPDFPGLADAEHCRDWETGIPIDLERIRDRDETYWDDHRGTPKAFVTLAAGQRMWENRFGNLTALRLDAATKGDALAAFRATFDPAQVGLFFSDVRGPAIASSATATDFGGLFLGLSFFLIVSALLLVALLFALGVEQRRAEVGTLLAIGYRPGTVRRILLREAAVLALGGAVVGALVGLGYTRLVLLGLETIWRDAVGPTSLGFHVQPITVIIGVVAAFASALAAIWFAVRRHVRRSAAALLSGADNDPVLAPRRAFASIVVVASCLLLAVVLIAVTGADRGAAAAGAFFGAGTLLLIAAIAGSRVLMVRLGRGTGGRPSVGALGVRNCVRSAGRSLAVVALIACGTFLVTAVGANRLDALSDAGPRSSGTGGFALVARATIGVPSDLDDPAARETLGLVGDSFAETGFVSMRVRAGDDASCLNLSLSRQPRLLGVDPDALASREAFTFSGALGDLPPSWRLLDVDTEAGNDVPLVPAIGDQASLAWAMHKGIGDTLDYVDERGQPFRVLIVGAVANSILQGNLLISERHFTSLFPSESGYGMFLIDAPADEAAKVSSVLSRALSDVGLEVTPATTRLAEFNAVQNTYLAIFQVLGGLGVLLGSAGLGMVVLRNILERRAELAVLRAVGFRRGALRWLVMSEHGLLLSLGLAGGAIAALVAVVPALRAPGASPPVGSTALVLAAIAASGVFWVWLATAWGLRGPILDALRNE